MSVFEVRPARMADATAYCDLFEAVAAERRWIGAEPPIDRDALVASLQQALTDEALLRVVADAQGELAGLLGAELWHGIVSLGMCVAADWRGRGVGSALLERCLGWAVAREAHKVTLQVWPHNEPAIALYERYGFAVEGRLRRHYRRASGELWDALIMGRVLADADRAQASA